MEKVYYNSYLISLRIQGIRGTFTTLHDKAACALGDKSKQMESRVS